jgi:hypothetical protein
MSNEPEIRQEYLLIVKNKTQQNQHNPLSGFADSNNIKSKLEGDIDGVKFIENNIIIENKEYNFYISKKEQREHNFFSICASCSNSIVENEFEQLILKTDQWINSLNILGVEVKTLWDGLSFHYAREAYPSIQQLENEARKLIIYHEQINLRHMQPSISLSLNVTDSQGNIFTHRNPLSDSYLTDLGDYLFIHNISHQHKELIDSIYEKTNKNERKCSSEKRKNRSEIATKIRQINGQIKTGLEILFNHKSNKFKDNLHTKLSNWEKLVEFRNAVAHNHSGLRKNHLEEIKKLTTEFISFFHELSDFQCEHHQEQSNQTQPSDVTIDDPQSNDIIDNIQLTDVAKEADTDKETISAEKESEIWEEVNNITTGINIYDVALEEESQKPLSEKGVLVDTNETYGEGSLWDMFENDYVAIYGDGVNQLNYLNENDIIFFYLKGRGIIAAAKIESGETTKHDDWCHSKPVRFLTKKPNTETKVIENEKVIPVREIRRITGKNFFWARTLKVPYLDSDEANNLLGNIILKLGKPDDTNS